MNEIVTFTWPYGEAANVLFACSSDNWKQVRMTQTGDQWVTHLVLSPGTYEYKFIVDGQWFYDICKPTTDNEFGSKNNVLVVHEPSSARSSVNVECSE